MAMRTTLTLDEDVAALLRREARRSGRSFKAVVNEAVREGLRKRREAAEAPEFRVEARALGVVPGLDYSKVAELLEVAEGPDHR